MESTYLPRARREGLRVNVIADETLLYDTDTDQTILLNHSAAFVWHNADGSRSVAELAFAMSEEFHIPADQSVVWYALKQLSSKRLMQEQAPVPSAFVKVKRRDLLTKAGLVGAALAIPVVISMVAPHPTHAQSCGIPDGLTCNGDAFACCSNCCVSDICVPFFPACAPP